MTQVIDNHMDTARDDIDAPRDNIAVARDNTTRDDGILARMERDFERLGNPPDRDYALHVLAHNGDEFTSETAQRLVQAPAELIDPLGRWVDPSDAASLRGEVVLVIGWHNITGEPVRGRAAADSDAGREWTRVRRVFLRSG
ncbi:MAG: hypothetical protein LBQ06_07980 [Frankiaceae bacterium]|jgi:hypothetical protein|nr:hypothetical protein [Frankiaceae bacterium]